MAPHVLLISSQKGGSGKTTLARSLAVSATRAGQRVLLLDLDPQRSLTSWWERREANDLDLAAPPRPAQIAEHVTGLEGYDLAIIDTPPSDHRWLAHVAAAATLALVPVRPSPDDLRAVGATLDMLDGAGCSWASVLSQVPPRARIGGEAARVLAQHGRLAPLNVHLRVAHAEAAATGLTATELGDAAATAELEELWRYVDTLLRQPTALRHDATPSASAI